MRRVPHVGFVSFARVTACSRGVLDSAELASALVARLPRAGGFGASASRPPFLNASYHFWIVFGVGPNSRETTL